MSKDADTPTFYGNVFQITRTPWDLTLHVHQGRIPADAKSGEQINLLAEGTKVASVTMPVDVAKLLIQALQQVTAPDAITIVPEAGESRHGS